MFRDGRDPLVERRVAARRPLVAALRIPDRRERAELSRALRSTGRASIHVRVPSLVPPPESEAIDVLLVDAALLERQVVDWTPSSLRPLTIVTSRRPDDAVAAFDYGAVDFLLLPTTPLRCADALRRVARELDRAAFAASLEPIADLGHASASRASAAPARLLVSSGRRTLFVELDSIDWISAEDVYSRVHVAGRSYLLRRSLTSLARALMPPRFLRTHRSAIVNVQHVTECVRARGGAVVLLLRTGAVVPVSKRRRLGLIAALGASPSDARPLAG